MTDALPLLRADTANNAFLDSNGDDERRDILVGLYVTIEEGLTKEEILGRRRLD